MPPRKTVFVMEAPVFCLIFFSESYIQENMITDTAHQRR